MSRRPATNRPHHPRIKAPPVSVTVAVATMVELERAALRKCLSVAAYLSELADVHAAELRRKGRKP